MPAESPLQPAAAAVTVVVEAAAGGAGLLVVGLAQVVGKDHVSIPAQGLDSEPISEKIMGNQLRGPGRRRRSRQRDLLREALAWPQESTPRLRCRPFA